MSVEQRDFNTFYMGDEVLRLAGGVVAELAGVTGIEVDGNNPDQLGQLVGAIGPDKVLRNNPVQTLREALPLERAADLIERSGIQLPLDRSLWHPEIKTPDALPLVMTGAVANWQDRAARLVVPRVGSAVYIPVGNREMNSPSELRNPNIQNFMQFDIEHPYPTEAEYANTYVRRELEAAGHQVELTPMDTVDGQTILNTFAAEHALLFDEQLAVVRVANAGVQLAYQLRRAARTVTESFDADRDNPQLFVLTDTLPVARTEEQVGDPANFQSPYTAMRQLALTAKLLAELGYEANA